MRNWRSTIWQVLVQWFFISAPGVGVMTVLTALGAATLAYFQKLPWVVVFLGAMLATALWLAITNQVLLRKGHLPLSRTTEAHPPPAQPAPIPQPAQPAHRTSEEIRNDIRDWLLRARYAVRQLPDHQPGRFLLEATWGREAPCFIAEGPDRTRPTVELFMLIPMEEELHRILDTLTGSHTPDLIFDLRITLAQIGAEFEDIVHPLRAIKIQRVIPISSLTELTFLREDMHIVRRSLHIVVNMIDKARRHAEVREGNGPG